MNSSALYIFGRQPVSSPGQTVARVCRALDVPTVGSLYKLVPPNEDTVREALAGLDSDAPPGFVPIAAMGWDDLVSLGETVDPNDVAALARDCDNIYVSLRCKDLCLQRWIARTCPKLGEDTSLSPHEIQIGDRIDREDVDPERSSELRFFVSISGGLRPRDVDGYTAWLRTAPWRVQLHRDLEAIVGPLEWRYVPALPTEARRTAHRAMSAHYSPFCWYTQAPISDPGAAIVALARSLGATHFWSSSPRIRWTARGQSRLSSTCCPGRRASLPSPCRPSTRGTR